METPPLPSRTKLVLPSPSCGGPSSSFTIGLPATHTRSSWQFVHFACISRVLVDYPCWGWVYGGITGVSQNDAIRGGHQICREIVNTAIGDTWGIWAAWIYQVPQIYSTGGPFKSILSVIESSLTAIVIRAPDPCVISDPAKYQTYGCDTNMCVLIWSP